MNTATTQEKTTTPDNQYQQFEALILPHEASLYGPAYRLTRSTSDAEDLVQDTMLRAYTRFASFRSDGSARAWLHTIMRNLFINTYRKKSREPQHISFDVLEGAGAGAGVERSGVTRPTTTSPERLVLSKMESDALLRAVAQLPAEYREAVVLADVDGLSYGEIAERLSIPVGTVRSRLNRGRKRVQRALFSWRDGDGYKAGRAGAAVLA